MDRVGTARADERGSAVRAPFYLLALLALVNAFNHLDRQLVSILLEPIRAEFALSDVQLGLLSGLAFAAFYTILSIPAALWAMRRSRVRLVAAAAALWGGMTILCGAAQNFTALLLARIGVGVGEAGCHPASQAMISDLYPPGRRAGAMAFFAAGVNLGIFLAFLVGGYVGQAFGWRAAFILAGAATMVLAVVLLLTASEPPRSADRHAAQVAPTRRRGAVAQAFAAIVRDPVLRHTVVGATITATVSYSVVAWLPSFLQRTHGIGLAQTGLLLALIIGIGGGFGTWAGGAISDRLMRRDVRWSLWFVAFAYIVTKPLSIGFYLTDGLALGLALFLLPAMTGGMFQGPAVATLHGRVAADLRPVASAIYLVMVNFIGLGLGPLLVGALSQYVFAGSGPDSLRHALVTMQLVGVWGGVHFWLAGRRLKAG